MTDREKYIILLNNDTVQVSDAIILLEGDGFNRIDKCVEFYNKGYAKFIVISGGLNKPEQGCICAAELQPVLIRKGIPSDSIIIEDASQNTHQQASEILKIAHNNSWKSIILVASNYHQYRAFLTFLKTAIEIKSSIRLYNGSVRDLDWFEETPWGKRIDLLSDEFNKIEKYRESGHVASYAEAIKYFEWKKKSTNF